MDENEIRMFEFMKAGCGYRQMALENDAEMQDAEKLRKTA
jgi:hypothetical protein